MSGRRRIAARIARDRRGNTVIEFGILAPVLMLMLMGLCDMVYQEYAQSILTGSLQKAARDSTIQDAVNNTDTIDGKVLTMMDSIMKTPVKQCTGTPTAPVIWCSKRQFYDTFSEVAPEPFSDTNGNGIRDPGECYTDQNANKQWDADPGTSGQGGAGAVATYSMTITYRRLFPIAGLAGISPTQTITSSTILKNQPYAAQSMTDPATVCT